MALFGTNGVRGIVGTTMTPQLALELGMAVGTWLGKGKTLGLGRDARDSGPMLSSAFAAGLQATGVHVVELGIAPSPAIQIHVRGRYDAGAVITASHNPPEWNGIKLVAPDGTETSRTDEEEVEAILAARRWQLVPWQEVGRLSSDDEAVDTYVTAIAEQVDVEAIRAAKLKVVLDCGGGAACEASPRLLKRLGVETVPLSCTFDGAFKDRKSEPTEENATRCIAAVKEHGAAMGILHDGDADRAIFIDERAEYIWGDQALALVVRHELSRHENRSVVTGVSSSTCVADAAAAAGGQVDWTRVGSPVIARRMIETGAPVGGEDNGGFLFARHQYARDGLMAAAFFLELLAKTKRPLSSLVAEVPRYALVKRKIEVGDDEKQPLVDGLRRHAKTIDGVREVDTQDGVKAYFSDGWFLVRPSGTEAIFRIQAEAREPDRAAQLADQAQAWVGTVRQSILA